MAKKGILEEALGDARLMKEAAIKNAENSLVVHFRDNLESVVAQQLNEEASGDEQDEDDELEEAHMKHDPFSSDEAMLEMEEEDMELDFEDEEDEEMDELDELEEGLFSDDDEEGLEESAGFTQADIQEVVRELLEVDHGSLGEMGEIDPDSHDAGLLDQDMKETEGWQEKQAPHKKDYYAGIKEAKRLRAKVVQLVTENKSLKKANRVLKESVREVNLFNKKLFVTHKLLNKKGLTESAKMKIVKKIDKARTSQEVDGIYESLEIALGVLSEGRTPRKKGSATLSEALGRHSRSEKGISNVNDAHLLNEDAKFSTNRLQFLAGIRKLDD